MARISQYKHGIVKSDERLKCYSALLGMLVALDLYSLSKKQNGNVCLLAYISVFSKEFNGKDEFELIQPLGDWLCSLPKGIWNDKNNK